MKSLSVIGLLLVLYTTGAALSQVIYTAPRSATITSLSLGSPSFTGGAADGTTVSAITVTTSNGTTPTLSLTGTQTGSGNDKDSFRVSGTSLLTNTSGGATDQPGQYSICVVATGTYTNSPQTSCGTVQATGPGGAGWQLTFSDEFSDPNGMLENLSTVSASSYTWASSFCSGLSSPSATGCGTLTVASLPDGITSGACAGTKLGACDISISGATNGGAGGDAAVNGTFLVHDVPDSTHIKLYMPYTGINATMGGTITVGSGPWTVGLNSSCTSGPCTGLPLIAANDGGNETQYWDPHACAIVSGIFMMNIRNTNNYIPPAGMQVGVNPAQESSACHIQTWNGSAGFSQTEEAYFDTYWKLSSSLFFTNWWMLAITNIWNNGPEVDAPECITSPTFCGVRALSNGEATLAGTDRSLAYHQEGLDLSSTTAKFLEDGVQSNSQSNPNSGTSWYPILDSGLYNSPAVTYPNSASVDYARVFTKVTSGACYSSIPSHSTVPHTGTC